MRYQDDDKWQDKKDFKISHDVFQGTVPVFARRD
jgi:hypothetical protein